MGSIHLEPRNNVTVQDWQEPRTGPSPNALFDAAGNPKNATATPVDDNPGSGGVSVDGLPAQNIVVNGGTAVAGPGPNEVTINLPIGGYDDTALQAAVGALQTEQTAQDAALANEIASTDAEQITQNGRLSSLEGQAITTDTEQAAQDARLDALEAAPPGGVMSISGPSVDNTDPANPVISDNDTIYDDTALQAAVAQNATDIAAEIASTDTEQAAQDARLDALEAAPPGGIQSIVAGTGVTVDNTDPANPVVNSTGVGGVASISGPSVDNTDPANPIIGDNDTVYDDTAIQASVAAAQADATQALTDSGNNSTLNGTQQVAINNLTAQLAGLNVPDQIGDLSNVDDAASIGTAGDFILESDGAGGYVTKAAPPGTTPYDDTAIVAATAQVATDLATEVASTDAEQTAQDTAIAAAQADATQGISDAALAQAGAIAVATDLATEVAATDAEQIAQDARLDVLEALPDPVLTVTGTAVNNADPLNPVVDQPTLDDVTDVTDAPAPEAGKFYRMLRNAANDGYDMVEVDDAQTGNITALLGSYVWRGEEDPANGIYHTNGQTIVDGVTTYPEAVSLLDPAWIVGNDIVLPDWQDRFTRDTGPVGGAVFNEQAQGTNLDNARLNTSSNAGGNVFSSNTSMFTNTGNVGAQGSVRIQGGNTETKPVSVTLKRCIVLEAKGVIGPQGPAYDDTAVLASVAALEGQATDTDTEQAAQDLRLDALESNPAGVITVTGTAVDNTDAQNPVIDAYDDSLVIQAATDNATQIGILAQQATDTDTEQAAQDTRLDALEALPNPVLTVTGAGVDDTDPQNPIINTGAVTIGDLTDVDDNAAPAPGENFRLQRNVADDGYNVVKVDDVQAGNITSLLGTFVWRWEEDPTNGIFHTNGQTVVDAVTDYADAIPYIDPSWIVGNDFVLPDWQDRFTRDTGALGGAVGNEQAQGTNLDNARLNTSSNAGGNVFSSNTSMFTNTGNVGAQGSVRIQGGNTETKPVSVTLKRCIVLQAKGVEGTAGTPYDDTAVLADIAALQTAEGDTNAEQAVQDARLDALEAAPPGGVQTVTGTAVDNTDAANPVIDAFDDSTLTASVTALETQATDTDTEQAAQDARLDALEAAPPGGVASISGPSVDNTDPANPIIGDNDTVYDDTAIQASVTANTADIATLQAASHDGAAQDTAIAANATDIAALQANSHDPAPQDAAIAAAQADATQAITDAAAAQTSATQAITNLAAEINATNVEQIAQNSAIANAQADATQGITDAATVSTALAGEIATTDTEQAAQDARLDALELSNPDGVQSISGPSVDNTDPANPVISDNDTIYDDTAVQASITALETQATDTDTEQAAQDARLDALEAAPGVVTVTGTAVDNTDPVNPIIDAFDPTFINTTLVSLGIDTNNNESAITALQTQATDTDTEQAAQDTRLDALEAATGGVASVTGTAVDNTDPANPVIDNYDDTVVLTALGNIATDVTALNAISHDPAPQDAAITAAQTDATQALANLVTHEQTISNHDDVADVSGVDEFDTMEWIGGVLTPTNNRPRIQLADVVTFVAVAGAGNEQAGDFNTVQEALDELLKHVFVGAAVGEVIIRDGVHDIDTELVCTHPQNDRISVRAENIPVANDTIAYPYDGNAANDLAAFQARYTAILRNVAPATRVFSGTYGNALPVEVEGVGLQNGGTFGEGSGIAPFGKQMNLRKCGIYGYRDAASVRSSGANLYLYGCELLHSARYGMYAVQGGVINATTSGDGETYIETTGNIAAYASGMQAQIRLQGSGANRARITRSAAQGARAFYSARVEIRRVDMDTIGNTAMQVTNGSTGSFRDIDVTNLTAGRTMDADGGSTIELAQDIITDAAGTATRRQMRAINMSYIAQQTNTNFTYSPPIGVEGNSNSLIG